MFYTEQIIDKLVKFPCEVLQENGDEITIALPQAMPFISSPCIMLVKRAQVSEK